MGAQQRGNSNPDHTLPHTIRSAPDAEMQSHGQSQEWWHQETNHPREALKAVAIMWYPRGQLKAVGCSKAALAKAAPTAWFGAFGRDCCSSPNSPDTAASQYNTQGQAAEVQNKLSHAKALETGQ